MDLNPAVFIVIGVALVIVVAVLAWYFEKKRREELAAWAREHGFTFDPGKRSSPGLAFSPFGQGHSRYSRYHMEKREEEAVPGLDHAGFDLFEYHYAVTTHSGKSSSTTHYHFTCALVDTGIDLGEMTIRREHLGDKLVQAIGFDDIDFEDAEFSKRFMVKARDRKRAYAFVDRRVMDFLLENPRWRIETIGADLFVFMSGKPTAARMDQIYGFASGLLRCLPRTLVNEERQRRGLPPTMDAGSAAEFHRRGEP
jgi:hypothetical protein